MRRRLQFLLVAVLGLCLAPAPTLSAALVQPSCCDGGSCPCSPEGPPCCGIEKAPEPATSAAARVEIAPPQLATLIVAAAPFQPGLDSAATRRPLSQLAPAHSPPLLLPLRV